MANGVTSISQVSSVVVTPPVTPPNGSTVPDSSASAYVPPADTAQAQVDPQILRWIATRVESLPLIVLSTGREAYYNPTVTQDLAKSLSASSREREWKLTPSQAHTQILAAIQRRLPGRTLAPLSQLVPKKFITTNGNTSDSEHKSMRQMLTRLWMDLSPKQREDWLRRIDVVGNVTLFYFDPQLRQQFPGYFMGPMDHRDLRSLLSDVKILVARVAPQGKLNNREVHYFVAHEDVRGNVGALRILTAAEYAAWDQATADKLHYCVRRLVTAAGKLQVLPLPTPASVTEPPKPIAVTASAALEIFLRSFNADFKLPALNLTEGVGIVAEAKPTSLANIQVLNAEAHTRWIAATPKQTPYLQLHFMASPDGRLLLTAANGRTVRDVAPMFVADQLRQQGDLTPLTVLERAILSAQWGHVAAEAPSLEQFVAGVAALRLDRIATVMKHVMPAVADFAQGYWVVGVVQDHSVIGARLLTAATYQTWLKEMRAASHYMQMKFGIIENGLGQLIQVRGRVDAELILKFVSERLRLLGESPELHDIERRMVSKLWDVNALAGIVPSQLRDYLQGATARRFAQVLAMTSGTVIDPNHGLWWQGYIRGDGNIGLSRYHAHDFSPPVQGRCLSDFFLNLIAGPDGQLKLVRVTGESQGLFDSLLAPPAVPPAQRGFVRLELLGAPIFAVRDAWRFTQSFWLAAAATYLQPQIVVLPPVVMPKVVVEDPIIARWLVEMHDHEARVALDRYRGFSPLTRWRGLLRR